MKLLLSCLMLMVFQVSHSADPIKLESQVIGDKEQPAVSYFVSWQGPSSTENLYRKEEDKYEKSIDTVDRDVMLRSMRIYDEMNLEGK